MAEKKIKPKYFFENPNTPKAVEQALRRILLEKLQSSNLTIRYKVN